MLSRNDILETIRMIDQQHLDIRTITMGISLLSCADSSAERACEKIYNKISRYAERLVATGEEIEREFGIPIVNKRVSVTPIALVAAASETEDYVPFAKALDRAAKNVGVNFIGGFSALVQKGMTDADRKLIAAIPEALACTDLVCSSVNVGSSKAGINMDAVALMGQTVKKTAALTEKQGGFGCAKLVIFCNAVEDNPFMAGRVPRCGRAGESDQRRCFRAGGCVSRAAKRQGPAVRRGGGDREENSVPHHAHGSARRAGGEPQAQYAVWHCRSFPCAHARRRRQRGPHSGGNGA